MKLMGTTLPVAVRVMGIAGMVGLMLVGAGGAVAQTKAASATTAGLDPIWGDLPKPMQEQIMTSVTRNEKNLSRDCKAAPKLVRVVRVKELPNLARVTKYEGNILQFAGDFDICGKTERRGVALMLPGKNSKAKPSITATLPGETVTDFVMQRDVATAVNAQAVKKPEFKGCAADQITIDDTKVTSKPSPDKPYTEQWILRGCGKTAPVTVTLTPDAQKGVTWKVD